MAATAEAGALIDENPPLDEVFPSDDTAPAATETAPEEASEETSETSAEPRTPRLTNNGVDLPESEEDTRPKRSGWWSRRGFL